MYKNRGRINIKIVIVLLLTVCAAGVLVYLHTTYTIRTVLVEGNVHYTEEEIKDIVMDGVLGDNSLYLSLKYRHRGVENIPFVDVMDVKILSPDTIRITVYEKVLTGYIKYMDTYMYFDKDGYVVECSSVKTEGVPQITGLTFDHMVLGEQLPIGDKQIFNRILEITKLLKKYELSADRIYFHASGEVTLYFGDIRVALGEEDEGIEDKFMRLPESLEQLQGKSGTLQMEKYDVDDGRYTFKPDRDETP